MIIFDQRWIGDHGIGRFARELFKSNIGKKCIKLNNKPTSIFDVFILTKYLCSDKNIYFTPGYNSPLLFLKRSVITVHDLNHIDVDNNSSILKRVYYNLILKRACRNARKIFTVSEFSKKRIIEWSGMDEKNIFVLGNGVSEVFNISAKPHENYRNYVLIVGNRKTHKNEERALESFLTADIDPNIKLIFTGNETESLKAIILKFNASKRVHFTGNVGDKELASLYKSANFLLFPSLYEGFGLPVIEAMACGTAVITSNTTSLVEIAEDGALLVNPRDITEITKAIEFFSNKPESKDKFIDRGIIISKKYSWDKIRKKFDEQMCNL